jgi:hypothetical protein
VCETRAFQTEFPIQVVTQAKRYFPYTNQQGGLILRLWMRLLLLLILLLGIVIVVIAAVLADHLFVRMDAYFRLVLYFRGSFSKIYGL